MNDLILKDLHEHKFLEKEEWSVDLIGGRYTKFIVLQCQCGESRAFPEANLEIAISLGTEETKKMIKDTGLRLSKFVD